MTETHPPCKGRHRLCKNTYLTLSEGTVKREVVRCRLTNKHPDYCVDPEL